MHDDPELGPKLAKTFGVSEDDVRRRVEELAESNPMLGHRGCRLGIVYPEITAMQTRAIFEAACQLKKEGIEIEPEVMIPLAGFKAEFEHQAKVVRDTAAEVFEEQGVGLHFLVGTMIEIPRAAITAGNDSRFILNRSSSVIYGPALFTTLRA